MSTQIDYWKRLSALDLDAAVLDPNDRHGQKNRYLMRARGLAFESAFSNLRRTPKNVLDLGCGTGSLSAQISHPDRSIVGLDISHALLVKGQSRPTPQVIGRVQYDGVRFPFCDQSFDAICTYVVLNHITEYDSLVDALSECRRVLRPQGSMVAVEQVARRTRLDATGWKRIWTPKQLDQAFRDAGLKLRTTRVVRYGHSPPALLATLGLLPAVLHRSCAQWEQQLGKRRGLPRFDYCDRTHVLDRGSESSD